jgi:hypothetical protein
VTLIIIFAYEVITITYYFFAEAFGFNGDIAH